MWKFLFCFWSQVSEVHASPSSCCKPPTPFSEHQDIELSSFLPQCLNSQYFGPRSLPFAVLPGRFLLLSQGLSDKHWKHSGGSSTVHLPWLETAWAQHVPCCATGREDCHPLLGLRTGRNPSKNPSFHAFLMSLCEVGLPEAPNLTKCGNFFVEMGKNTFLTSEGPSTPSTDQKTTLSSKLGRDY